MSLNEIISQGTAVNLVGAACLTALLYDHVITLDQEVEKMWPTRLSIAKILFFLNRYPVEAMLLFNCISAAQRNQSESFCIFYLRWLQVVSTTSTTIVQAILVLRVWAIHKQNKPVLAIAFFTYFGGVAVSVGLLIQDYVGEDVIIDKSLANFPGCYALSVPSIIAGFWIGPLIVETVLFLLVVFRAYFWWKDGMALPRILMRLARDSTFYFLVIFTLLLANYLVFELGPPLLSSLLVTPSTTAGCILASHMILNLRASMADSCEVIDDATPGPKRTIHWAQTRSVTRRYDPYDSTKVVPVSADQSIEFATMDFTSTNDYKPGMLERTEVPFGTS